MISAAIQYLSANLVSHTDMIEPIRRGTAEMLSFGKNGVLLLEKRSGAYMIAADTAKDGISLLSLIISPKLMSIHQRDTAYEAARRFGLTVTMECYNAVWMRQFPPTTPGNAFDIRVLTQEHAQFVMEAYSHPGIGSGYINGRIAAGEMFGAFSGNELAGFIGLHEEGSMGMLEVARKFRRQGAGTCLIANLCAWLIKHGRTPYSQFTADNLPSRNLHEHMGFQISNNLVYWLENR